MNKFGFYLLGKKGFDVLNAVIENFDSGYISFVRVGRDSGVEDDYHDRIVELCASNDINVYEKEDKTNIEAEYRFAIGWRWIINNSINLIVLHDSILPAYRGFAPLVNMLINGEKEIGVTALFASDKYDEGPIISQGKIDIQYPIKIREAINLVSSIYCQLTVDICRDIVSGTGVSFFKQDNNKASYSIWRDELDYKIDWSESAEDIKRFCDAVSYPYSGAKSYINEKLCTINEVDVLDYDVNVVNRNKNIGKVIFFQNKFPVVVCGNGLLVIKQIDNDIVNIKFRTRFVS